MTTYFTSDLHIGHRYVAGIRGFWGSEGVVNLEYDTAIPDVEAHNQAVTNAFSVVKSDDIVWIQGDICISSKTWTTALLLLKDLPGRKRLICGNHDPASSVHRDAWKFRQGFVNEVFETVQDFATIKLAGQTVLLSHYPYAGVGSEGIRGGDGSPAEERFTEFRLTDCGRILLHGHTHGPERLHFSEAGTPQVHIGLDAWGMNLVSQYEVEKLLSTVDRLINMERNH